MALFTWYTEYLQGHLPYSCYRRRWILSMQWPCTMLSPRFNPHPATACPSTIPMIASLPPPCSQGGWGRPPEVSCIVGHDIDSEINYSMIMHMMNVNFFVLQTWILYWRHCSMKSREIPPMRYEWCTAE